MQWAKCSIISAALFIPNECKKNRERQKAHKIRAIERSATFDICSNRFGILFDSLEHIYFEVSTVSTVSIFNAFLLSTPWKWICAFERKTPSHYSCETDNAYCIRENAIKSFGTFFELLARQMLRNVSLHGQRWFWLVHWLILTHLKWEIAKKRNTHKQNCVKTATKLKPSYAWQYPHLAFNVNQIKEKKKLHFFFFVKWLLCEKWHWSEIQSFISFVVILLVMRLALVDLFACFDFTFSPFSTESFIQLVSFAWDVLLWWTNSHWLESSLFNLNFV